ncbi:L-lactate permease [Campylobacter sp. FMV-PI01]|uniref:L-lactate permease n=1 Tax=Campylobacter portucalensis TaxID=2608384 RepID=A0A6L5WHJ4_9BACT|nr:lactate permease LctP family transporter [Campylobacter portucalensis]MSN96559.1 L-lactate permease [Campylobacter portucalensis]
MMWNQIYDPLGNIWLSAAIASLPLICFLACLVFLKLKGHIAAIITVCLAFLIAIFMYKMPVTMAVVSIVYGFMYGLWPIAWIIIAAIFLYKLSIKSGQFEIIKQSVLTITPDQRIQVILIGFCFGAFLEGAIGFGGPVAITAALLAGLGLRPLYAAGLCMIANTAPVAFGAVGIPIIAMAGAVGVDAKEISAMTGYMLPPLTIFVPFFIMFLMDGFKGVKETFPAILVASLSFAITQFITAVYVGPELPDITSAVVSLAATTLFLKFWQPKNIFTFDGEKQEKSDKSYSIGEVMFAWSPFLILIIMIILWTSLKGALNFATFKFEIPFLHNLVNKVAPIVSEPTAMGAVFKFDVISAIGTAIFFTALISAFIAKTKTNIIANTFKETINEMKFPILTIGLVLSFAYIANFSGLSATLATALAHTGKAFTFFSPIIGWIGVFLTGSDTSSNLLFGTLQQATAHQLGLKDTLFLAANSVGGVVGKMISPQSVAIACAAVGLVGKESDLMKFTVKYSILFVIFIGLWTSFIAYVTPWIIP